MKRKLFWIILVIAACVAFAVNYMNELKTVTVFSMDTIMTVKMSGSKKNLEWAESEIERLDKIFNVYDSESEIYKLNQSGEGKMSKEMAEVLAGAMGNYVYLARFATEEEVFEFVKYVFEKEEN